MKRLEVKDLRSQRWFGAPGKPGASKYYRMRQAGFEAADHHEKPVIGIISTWSDFNTCHALMPNRIEDVKRGVWQAGGFPAVIPVQSVSESFQRPSAMLYRNFLAMEVEEQIRSQPVDGVVLLGGCDKTTPGLIMGAASAGVPAIFVPAGATLRGMFKGAPVGTGSSNWKAQAEYRAGKISAEDARAVGFATVRSAGTCNTMGTASTMTALVEAMGLSLPGASSIPAVDAAHPGMASASGRRIVDMVWEGITPDRIVTAAALHNALVTDMALSGSTNSIIHIIAMARRFGLDVGLDDFTEAGRDVPVICNLMPSGKYLMEDFFYADVIRPLDNPVYPAGGLAVLRGNLAPRGAVLKRSAADPRLLKHTGPAVVFDTFRDMLARIDDPDLDVTAESVLVLRNAGPVGAPGMPEWGMMPIPKKLLAAGVRDMVRVSDARMSGTSFGTCVLHVCPESRVGGPLALVEDGDMIGLDADAGTLELLVDDAELEARRARLVQPPPHYVRGYGAMFAEHVLQADEGCDFDFLARPGAIPEPEVLAP
jgi:dihydroxyacid dehydratase/phosphogluconate dehydratase